VTPARPPLHLSIVAPLHDEVTIVEELMDRCTLAGEACSVAFEVVLVDDASRDGTGDRIAAREGLDPRVRLVRLARNRGQLGATKAGLARARGAVVVVLDGDLQDPPEVIPSLVQALGPAPGDVAFAVKSDRDDPRWFFVGQALFHGAQELLSSARLPKGAGSFCAMHAELAARASRVRVRHANLSAVLAGLRVQGVGLGYRKLARYDGRSRVGPLGLAREAVGSLVLAGAASRLLAGGAAVAVGAMVVGTASGARVAPLVAGTCATGLAALAVASEVARRLMLSEQQASVS
jgi:dolichol-phosphate mannosyltransferase